MRQLQIINAHCSDHPGSRSPFHTSPIGSCWPEHPYKRYLLTNCTAGSPAGALDKSRPVLATSSREMMIIIWIEFSD
jgi:hypothetical protein